MRRALIVCEKELRDGLRDRRAILSALVLPLVGPLMMAMTIFFLADVSESLDEVPIAIAGLENAPGLRIHLENSGAVLTDIGADGLDAGKKLVEDEVHELVVVVADDFGDKMHRARPAKVWLITDGTNKRATPKVRRVENLIQSYSQYIATLRLIARGIHPEVAAPIELQRVETASQQRLVATNLLSMIPLFLLMAAFVGALPLAIDTSAGERERGSMESLLLAPLPRSAIALGKWLATTIFSFGGIVLTTIGFVIALRYVPLERLDITADFGAKSAALVVLLLLPAAALAAAMLLFAASFAKSFKEAQSSATMLIFLPMIPGLIGTLYGLGDNPWLSFVPLAAQQMLLTQILSSETPPLFTYGAVYLTCLAAAAVFLWLTARLFANERILFRN